HTGQRAAAARRAGVPALSAYGWRKMSGVSTDTGPGDAGASLRKMTMGGRSLGFALAAVGAGLLGWVGWQMMQPVPSPYAIVAAPDAQTLVKDVDFTLPDGYSSHGYEVRVEGV